jgi:hypothetical protein
MFRRAGVNWIQHEKLKGLRIAYEQLGASVALNGDWLVAGAPDLSSNLGGSPGPGRAYVFRRDDRNLPDDPTDDAWEVAAILHPPPSHLTYGAGVAVDVADDVIVVGTSSPSNRTGRAYVFRWDGTEWLSDARLTGADTEPGDSFGRSVGTSRNTVVVGAPDDDAAGERSGSAYVFEYADGTWVQVARLVASDAEARDNFGDAVAVAGDTIAVGAKNEDGAGANSGAVYVFRREPAAGAAKREVTAWVEHDKLIPSGVAPLVSFGLSVAMDSDRLIVGATRIMSADVFQRNGDDWIEVHPLLGIEGSPLHPVAVDGRYSVVASHVYAVGETFTLSSYGEFQRCFGARDPMPPECMGFDFEPEGTIDLRDHALLLQTFRGP